MQHDDSPLATTPISINTEMGSVSVFVLKTKSKLDQYPVELGIILQNESEDMIGSVKSYLTSPYTRDAAMSTMINMLGYLTTRNPHHVGRLNNYHNYVMLAKINDYNLKQEILAEAVKSHIDKIFVYQPNILSEKNKHTESQSTKIHDAWVVSIDVSTPNQSDMINSASPSTTLKFISFSEEYANKFQHNILRWIREEPDIILLLTQGSYEFVTNKKLRPTDANQLQIDITTAEKIDGVKQMLITLDKERKDFISMLTSLNNPLLSSLFVQPPSETTKRPIYANSRALQASKTILAQQVGTGHKQSLITDYALHILDLNNLIVERGSELTSTFVVNHAIQSQIRFNTAIEDIKNKNVLSPDERIAFQHYINNKIEDLSMLSIAEQTSQKEAIIRQLDHVDLRRVVAQCTHPISSDILMIDQHELNDSLDSTLLRATNNLVASNESTGSAELTFENYKTWMNGNVSVSASSSDNEPSILAAQSIPELEPSSSTNIEDLNAAEDNTIEKNHEVDPKSEKAKPTSPSSFQMPSVRSLYSFFGGKKNQPSPSVNIKHDEVTTDINKIKDKLAIESPSEPSINIKRKR